MFMEFIFCGGAFFSYTWSFYVIIYYVQCWNKHHRFKQWIESSRASIRHLPMTRILKNICNNHFPPFLSSNKNPRDPLNRHREKRWFWVRNNNHKFPFLPHPMEDHFLKGWLWWMSPRWIFDVGFFFHLPFWETMRLLALLRHDWASMSYCKLQRAKCLNT